MKTSAELRTAFLNFFNKHGHEIVPSAPLVPGNDATLLFTNAGMVQFKEIFLGQESSSYKRATTSQRCVRAGGKHNDLENVGYTARHHTFFEMLGNFSFGDYFKHEAIQYAWQFLTEELKIPAEKLWVTVFDEDDEAADIWLKEIGVDPQRLTRIGAKDNFWSMGDTGPCGPCSEIFYDHGSTVAGGPPGSPEEDGDRFVEIWNLVFMQYDRAQDGMLTPLPKPSVDTGMGLERLAAVMQEVHSNYETDLFQYLIRVVAKMAGTDNLQQSSLRVVADHIRACSFLVVDGVIPSNEGRGYVLRRIIRRAARHGHQLGINGLFFHQLVRPVVDVMGDAYPELVKAQAQVERVLKMEEERFAETLEQGLKHLESDIASLGDKKVISGESVFRLYDTYGFPVDLTADFARERGLTIDMDAFNLAMTAQRERARAGGHFGVDYSHRIKIESATEFTGYDRSEDESKIVALYQNGEAVEQLNAGESGDIILKNTPFYGESGGQAGESGQLIGEHVVFDVKDTQKQGTHIYIHHGIACDGVLRKGDPIKAVVNSAQRQASKLNHTATHLLHAALRQVLGEHVAQKGSLVDSNRLRFDFSHFETVTNEQLQTIETLVNAQIRNNDAVVTDEMSPDEAAGKGAMALFGEKYGDVVRVVGVGDFSIELCGGIHVKRAGEIGLFKITLETGIAAGVRRIEAVTGVTALNWVQKNDSCLAVVSEMLKTGRDEVKDKVKQLQERVRKFEKEIEQLKGKLASSQGDELSNLAEDVQGIKVLSVCLDGADVKTLRSTLDQLKNKLGSAVIVLATKTDSKVSIVAGVSKDNTDCLKAGEIVNMVAQQVGGKGGGRPDMAQAGGNNPAALDGALASVLPWVKERLSS